MNIIFFDIDGVLNYQNHRFLIDWDIVDRLKQMAIDCDAKLVMSSSWKDTLIRPETYNKPDQTFVFNLVKELGDLFIGHTPEIDDDYREEEIQAWLNKNPGINNFVILDDLDFGLPEAFPDNFVKTTGYSEEGFSLDNEKRAREILMR